MEFLDNGDTCNTLPVSKRTFYIVLKALTQYYIHKTFRKQPTEEGSSEGKGKGHPVTGHEGPEVE